MSDREYGCLVCEFGTDDWGELLEHHWEHGNAEWSAAVSGDTNNG